MESLFLVGAGGFLGAVSRYLVAGWVSRFTSPAFPWGTFTVNVTGSFLLALIITLILERFLSGGAWRLFLGIGFLGAYTTFSTFAWETDSLLREGAWLMAGVNVAANVAAALLAARFGLILARIL